MIRLILSEWKLLWRDRRLPAALICFVLLSSVALWSTARSNEEIARTSALAEHQEYERWLGQGAKYAHAAAHYGIYVFRPITRLQNFDPGVAPFVGETVFLEAHVQDPLLYRPSDDRVAGPGFGDVTPAVLVFVVLPLFVLLLGFNMATAEKTAGAGWLTQVSASSPLRLLGSKVLALAAPLAVPSVLIPLIAFATARHAGQVPLPSESLRWITVALLCLASVLCWIVLTVACSSLSRTAGQSLAMLLAAWIVVCLVLPRAVAATAAWLVPTLNQQQLSTDIRKATGEGEDGDREEQLKQALFHKYNVTSLEALPVEWDGIHRQAAEEAGNTVFDTFWGKLLDQYSAQGAIVAKASFVSPVSALSTLSESLAGSRVEDHAAFIHQAERHRRLIQRTMNTELSRKRSLDAGPRPNSSPDLWKRVPPFQFHAPPLRAAVRESGGSFWFALSGFIFQAGLVAVVFFVALRGKQGA